jgi:hypothetical protein
LTLDGVGCARCEQRWIGVRDAGDRRRLRECHGGTASTSLDAIYEWKGTALTRAWSTRRTSSGERQTTARAQPGTASADTRGMTATLRSAIDAVRRRPGMFLAKKSLHDLRVFLTGYLFALDRVRWEVNPDPSAFTFHGQELRAFERWLAKRLGRREDTGLERLLLVETGDDDEAAFHLFFVRWDELCTMTTTTTTTVP